MKRTKLPKRAEKVAQYIRDNVKRPRTLPNSSVGYVGRLGWGRSRGGFHVHCCPLGLVRGADPVPDRPSAMHRRHLPFTQRQMESFFEWWDTQQDPEWAVNQVWGPA